MVPTEIILPVVRKTPLTIFGPIALPSHVSFSFRKVVVKGTRAG